MILPSASEDLKEALRDYAAKNDEYMRMVAKDDVDRIHLLKSIGMLFVQGHPRLLTHCM